MRFHLCYQFYSYFGWSPARIRTLLLRLLQETSLMGCTRLWAKPADAVWKFLTALAQPESGSRPSIATHRRRVTIRNSMSAVTDPVITQSHRRIVICAWKFPTKKLPAALRFY